MKRVYSSDIVCIDNNVLAGNDDDNVFTASLFSDALVPDVERHILAYIQSDILLQDRIIAQRVCKAWVTTLRSHETSLNGIELFSLGTLEYKYEIEYSTKFWLQLERCYPNVKKCYLPMNLRETISILFCSESVLFQKLETLEIYVDKKLSSITFQLPRLKHLVLKISNYFPIDWKFLIHLSAMESLSIDVYAPHTYDLRATPEQRQEQFTTTFRPIFDWCPKLQCVIFNNMHPDVSSFMRHPEMRVVKMNYSYTTLVGYGVQFQEDCNYLIPDGFAKLVADSKLTHLELRLQRIPGRFKMGPPLIETLSSLKHLTTLVLCDNVHPLSFEKVCSTIGGQLKRLKCSFMCSDADAQFLNDQFYHLKNLESLVLEFVTDTACDRIKFALDNLIHMPLSEFIVHTRSTVHSWCANSSSLFVVVSVNNIALTAFLEAFYRRSTPNKIMSWIFNLSDLNLPTIRDAFSRMYPDLLDMPYFLNGERCHEVRTRATIRDVDTAFRFID